MLNPWAYSVFLLGRLWSTFENDLSGQVITGRRDRWELGLLWDGCRVGCFTWRRAVVCVADSVLNVRLSRWGVTGEWGRVSWSLLIASMTTSSLPLRYDMHCTRARRTGLQLHGLFLGGIHSARPSQVNFICAKWSFDPRTVRVCRKKLRIHGRPRPLSAQHWRCAVVALLLPMPPAQDQKTEPKPKSRFLAQNRTETDRP